MSTPTRPVRTTRDLVVGADGTPASANALRYAMKEAARTGAGVEVLHVVPDYAPMAGMYPIPPSDLVDAGRTALASTVGAATPAGTTPPEGVVTRLVRGAVVKVLSEAGLHAQAVVLGSDRRAVPMRLLTGNVSTGVAARAAVPVVTVPETWDARRDTGTVLVAVKRSRQAQALMAEAFGAFAARRGARLVVLHAWRLPHAYDDLVVGSRSLADWGARVERELEKIVAPWRSGYPQVDVELRTVHDHAAHALVSASADADELVIVRRAYGVTAAHLGSTARTVLLHAHCPVRVVPAVPTTVLPYLEHEAAGAPLLRATT